jgi:hypothetical protein
LRVIAAVLGKMKCRESVVSGERKIGQQTADA